MNLQPFSFMNTEFDAEAFFSKLKKGEFDGNLCEVLRKLTTPDLEKIADLVMAKRFAESDREGRPCQSL